MYQQHYKETIAKEHRKRQYLLLPFFFIQFQAGAISRYETGRDRGDCEGIQSGGRQTGDRQIDAFLENLHEYDGARGSQGQGKYALRQVSAAWGKTGWKGRGDS